MQHPELIYWLLVGLLAVPSSLFSRVAAVVVLVRMVSQIAWQAGFPEPSTQAIVYFMALPAALQLARGFATQLAAILFLPLFCITVAGMTDIMSPVETWWSIYWVAILQVALLPLGVEWRVVWRSFRKLEMPDLTTFTQRVFAPCL